METLNLMKLGIPDYLRVCASAIPSKITVCEQTCLKKIKNNEENIGEMSEITNNENEFFW